MFREDARTIQTNGKKVRQLLLGGLLAALAFALTAIATRHLLPPRHVPDLSKKLDWLTRHQGDYDTLFVGSSHVFMQIDPATFDAEMARLGTPTHSYNLGLGGMGALERDYVIDEVLRRCPNLHLKLAVVELQPSFNSFPEAFRHSVREIYWRDLRRTTELCGQILATMSDIVASPRKNDRWHKLLAWIPDLGDHVRLFFSRFASVGRVAMLLQPPPKKKDEAKVLRETKMDVRGFAPLHRIIPDAEFAAFRQNYAERDRYLHGRPPLDPGTAAMLAQLRRTGAAVCFFVSPNSQGTHPALVTDAEKNHAPVLRYDDRTKYPQFYAQEYRSDDLHVNSRGAEIFTRTLADDVAAHLSQGSLKLTNSAPDHALR